MFNLGISEFLIIGAIALMIFGPDKLPNLIRTFGKGMAEFKRTINTFKHDFNQEVEESIKKTDAAEQLREFKDIKQELQSDINDLRSNNVSGFIEQFSEESKSETSKRPKYDTRESETISLSNADSDLSDKKTS